MVGRTKKITLAREQLEDGVQLLLERRFVSALTLLGAAEEILSRLAEEQGGKHFLDGIWEEVNALNRGIGGDDVSKRRIYRAFNEPRNSVKHHTPGDVPSVAIFKMPAALMMARRAKHAADYLGLKYRNKQILEERLAAWHAECTGVVESGQNSLN
jgi:hypothetical protein